MMRHLLSVVGGKIRLQLPETRFGDYSIDVGRSFLEKQLLTERSDSCSLEM